MRKDIFDLSSEGARSYWFERDEAGVGLFMESSEGSTRDFLIRLDKKTLGDLLVWSDDDAVVSAIVTGPMAKAIKKNARRLGLTDEMFVWHAVKLFLDIGEGG